MEDKQAYIKCFHLIVTTLCNTIEAYNIHFVK